MNGLKAISISHQTANLTLREQFTLTQEEQTSLIKVLKVVFNAKGVLILATCNRTEIYLEGKDIDIAAILDYLFTFKKLEAQSTLKKYFTVLNTTIETAQYLLEVASGLRSLVIGDMQIINQVKIAFQKAQTLNCQGQLLERLIQSIFKTHKRIQNETKFRSGSACASYLSLQIAQQILTKPVLKQKSLLLVGAGSIIQEVAQYAHKFPFKTITIANRTYTKGEAIAKEHHFQTTEWSNLETAIEAADVIITGVSNCGQLIKDHPKFKDSSKVFVDLGMPANIDKAIANHPNIQVIDIDELSQQTQQIQNQRLASVSAVQKIIESELQTFNQWLAKIPINQSLSKLKTHIQALLKKEMSDLAPTLSELEKSQFIKRVSQQLIKRPAIFLHKQKDIEYADTLEQFFAL